MSEGNVQVATKGKRFAAGVIDLVIIPILLGLVMGAAFLGLGLSVAVRAVLLVVVNMGWFVIRDTVYSPGRQMVGIRLTDSATDAKITVKKALIRNILLYIPYVLIIGYLIEIFVLFTKGERLGDRWAGTRVLEGAS